MPLNYQSLILSFSVVQNLNIIACLKGETLLKLFSGVKSVAMIARYRFERLKRKINFEVVDM